MTTTHRSGDTSEVRKNLQGFPLRGHVDGRLHTTVDGAPERVRKWEDRPKMKYRVQFTAEETLQQTVIVS